MKKSLTNYQSTEKPFNMVFFQALKKELRDFAHSAAMFSMLKITWSPSQYVRRDSICSNSFGKVKRVFSHLACKALKMR